MTQSTNNQSTPTTNYSFNEIVKFFNEISLLIVCHLTGDGDLEILLQFHHFKLKSFNLIHEKIGPKYRVVSTEKTSEKKVFVYSIKT